MHRLSFSSDPIVAQVFAGYFLKIGINMRYPKVMDRFDPARPDFSPYGFSCVRWQPTTMPRCDRHNEIELNFLGSGSVTYLMGGQKVTVPAGRLAVFWAGIPHQIVAFEGLSEYFVLTLPLVWFLQWRLPEHFTQEILQGGTLLEPNTGRLVMDQQQLLLWSDDLSSGSPERRQASLLEIEARLRRLALSVHAERLSEADSLHKAFLRVDAAHLSKAEEIACFIAQNYTQPLSAAIIGHEVGLHPNYAMALFQQTFGTTLTKYLTQHRLSHAQRLLITTTEPIVQIALSSGFGSLSRFNEAFRQLFACTPREYRQSQFFLT
jgi:AraC family transcriptional regulator, melibiose operon regulatory protein